MCPRVVYDLKLGALDAFDFVVLWMALWMHKKEKRVVDAIELVGISLDDKRCSLVINAYAVAGQSQKALITFENMRRVDLERDGIMVGKKLMEY
ncbi:Pentatricopeptide repeat-containing protein, partial [Mucuna pruriens]